MKMSELIAHVGDENIQVQGLNSSLVSAKARITDGEITFATDRDKVMALSGIGEEKYRCMIVWLLIDKLP